MSKDYTRVKDFAKEYYPTYWDINKIISLVKVGKLTKEEFKEITGKDYTE